MAQFVSETHSDSSILNSTESALWFNLTTVPPHSVDHFKATVTFLNVYLTPIIIFIGFVSNSVAASVFLWTPLRHQSSSVYLAALAIVDTGFLATVLTNWFTWITERFFSNVVWCQLVIYFGYTFAFLSVWYLLAFTVERYIAVCHPLTRFTLCSTKRAKIVVCLITAIAAVAYNFALWTSRVVLINGKPFCIPKDEFMKAIVIVVGIDGALTMIIPSIVIVVLNLRIGVGIYSAHHYSDNHLRSAIMPVPSATSSTGISTTATSVSGKRCSAERRTSNQQVKDSKSDSHCRRSIQRPSSAQQQYLKTNRLLFMVSAMFVLLNGPSYVIRSYYMYRQMASAHFRPSSRGIQLQECFQILYYMNFSVNFFLYSLGAKRFRAAMNQMWRNVFRSIRGACQCRRGRLRDANPAGQKNRRVRPDQGESQTLIMHSKK